MFIHSTIRPLFKRALPTAAGSGHHSAKKRRKNRRRGEPIVSRTSSRADVVGLEALGGKLFVDLFHCKHTKAEPGNRIKDLYEVCGQAVRSIKWRDDIDRLFLHLINREKRRMKKHGVTRFERGDFKRLVGMRGAARELAPEFRIFVVQPGLSKAGVTDDQRELLSTTELYLHETRSIKLVVIGSP